MPRLQTLIDAETQIATARGLMEMLHFFYDHASDEDWVHLRGNMGFLLNTISDKLRVGDQKVEIAFQERYQEEGPGRPH